MRRLPREAGPWGLHVTGCERRHDRFERHDAVVHAVAAKFNELGIKAKIEVRDIIADTQRRPGDVALPAGVTISGWSFKFPHFLFSAFFCIQLKFYISVYLLSKKKIT